MQMFGAAIAALGLAGVSAGVVWTASARSTLSQLDRMLGTVSAVIVAAIGLVLRSIPL